MPLWFSQQVISHEPEIHQLLNFTMWAMEDLKFHIEVQILWGLWISLAPLFNNTASVNIWAPLRARDTRGIPSPTLRPLENGLTDQGRIKPVSYYWAALYKYDQLATLAVPLNLPPRYLSVAEGRVLMGYNVSSQNPGVHLEMDDFATVHKGPDYWQAPTGAVGPNTNLYREIFQSILPNPLSIANSQSYSYQFDTLLLPYVPFVSNCYGYDSYLFWHVLFEDSQNCAMDPYTLTSQTASRQNFPPLPSVDDIAPALPWDGLNILVGENFPVPYPISDSCAGPPIPCNFEEFLGTPDANPRWFESQNGDSLFVILREALTDKEWQQQKLTVNEQLIAPSSLDDLSSLSDNQIPVIVTHDADLPGSCILNCYPRAVNLAITYMQMDTIKKRITSAEITFGPEFDRDPLNTNYTFTIDWYASNYSDLVNGTQFGPSFFSFVYVVIGLAMVGIAFALWLFWRVIFSFVRGFAPPFNLVSWVSIVIPQMITGFCIGNIPVLLNVLAIFFLLKGWYFIYNPVWGDSNTNIYGLDSVISSYLDVRVDPTQLINTRTMRIGSSFLVLGLIYMWLGANILMPQIVSKREKELLMGKDQRAYARDIWSPTAWRKLHYLYISICYAMILVFIVDLSFMDGFADDVYMFLIGFKLFAMFAGEYVEYTLGDSMLVAPIDCNMGIVQGLVTLGAPNLTVFIISYMIDLSFGYGELLFIEPLMGRFLGALFGGIEFISKRIKKYRDNYRKKTLMEELYEEEIEAERKKKEAEAIEFKALRIEAEKESLPIASKAAMKREERQGKKTKQAEGQAVEMIVNSLVNYTLDFISVLQSSVLILLMMYFRNEIGIPVSYGIREQDMRLYFYFSFIIVPFQVIWDMFKLSSLESIWNIKVYEYLVYARYRFLSRTHHWVGLQDNLDECLEGPYRRPDQMCFSSQYHLSIYIYTSGMFFFILGIIVLGVAGGNQTGNFLQDPAFPLIIFFNIGATIVIFWLCWIVSRYIKLWHVKGMDNIETSTMAEGLEGLYAIPGMDAIKKGSSLTPSENAFMNTRISSETFRFKFLDANRLWLIQNLPDILTPRTLRRSRPYLLGVLGKVLGAVDMSIPKGEVKVEDATDPLPFTNLDSTSRALMRWWLGMSRRNLRYRNLAQPLIDRAKSAMCESCNDYPGESKLKVELMIPVDALADRYEIESKDGQGFDEASWKAYFLRNQRFRTVCAACVKARGSGDLGTAVTKIVTTRTDPNMGSVDAGAIAREIARKWLDKARQRLKSYGPEGPRGASFKLPPTALNFGEEGKPKDGVGIDSRPVLLSSASLAIALRWLAEARKGIMTRPPPA